MGGSVSGVCRARERRALYRCGRARVRGLVFGRYRRDDRALAGRCGGRDCEAGARRHHADAANGRFCLGRRGIAAAVRAAVLAICVDGNGCEPVCDPYCAGDYPEIEDSGLQLLLSRNGGRIICILARRSGGAATGEYWTARKSH